MLIQGESGTGKEPFAQSIHNYSDRKEGFDFLGFHHRNTIRKNKNNKEYRIMMQIPTNKAMKNMRENKNSALVLLRLNALVRRISESRVR